MAQLRPGMSLSPFQKMSLLRLNSATMAPTESCGPFNAARAALWVKEAVQELPERTVHLLRSGPCPYQMIRFGDNVYATQFHPEAEGSDFVDRVRIYRNKGYFPPEEADEIAARCAALKVHVPRKILRRFVERYGARLEAAAASAGEPRTDPVPGRS